MTEMEYTGSWGRPVETKTSRCPHCGRQVSLEEFKQHLASMATERKLEGSAQDLYDRLGPILASGDLESAADLSQQLSAMLVATTGGSDNDGDESMTVKHVRGLDTDPDVVRALNDSLRAARKAGNTELVKRLTARMTRSHIKIEDEAAAVEPKGKKSYEDQIAELRLYTDRYPAA
jgi:hypothetical protein